jgi:hypothetical protein
VLGLFPMMRRVEQLPDRAPGSDSNKRSVSREAEGNRQAHHTLNPLFKKTLCDTNGHKKTAHLLKGERLEFERTTPKQNGFVSEQPREITDCSQGREFIGTANCRRFNHLSPAKIIVRAHLVMLKQHFDK